MPPLYRAPRSVPATAATTSMQRAEVWFQMKTRLCSVQRSGSKRKHARAACSGPVSDENTPMQRAEVWFQTKTRPCNVQRSGSKRKHTHAACSGPVENFTGPKKRPSAHFPHVHRRRMPLGGSPGTRQAGPGACHGDRSAKLPWHFVIFVTIHFARHSQQPLPRQPATPKP